MTDEITLLKDKTITLAVTGSIAAYKAVDLASKLTQAGASVDVIMTEAAQRFVTPLTFQSVTGRPVYTHLWQTDSGGSLPTHIAHVGIGESSDLLAVIPATANTIARLAHGAADDLLTISALAIRAPLLIAPAMDGAMYDHPATRANVRTLVERGAYLLEPDYGRFASGLHGRGRLPDTATLIGHIRRLLGQNGALSGRHIIVTAGGTREAIDPVRFVGNHSSGKQGYALAQAAVDAGARVTLITTVDRPAPLGVSVAQVTDAHSMREALMRQIDYADALIMAAAVADFRPDAIADQKIKKEAQDDNLVLTLTRTDDILLHVKDYRAAKDVCPLRVVVGFAAESQDVLDNAQRKLERKGLDLIAANDITATDAGFAADTNRVTLLAPNAAPEVLDLMSKTQTAERIVQRVADLLG